MHRARVGEKVVHRARTGRLEVDCCARWRLGGLLPSEGRWSAGLGWRMAGQEGRVLCARVEGWRVYPCARMDG